MKRNFNVRGIKDRSGSALLIVLGMFAFMLVSAVAFSVYMRASRAPSSFLRRNTATRQLVRAALARAIDEVDTAIGNDPFPGVGYNHDYQTGQGSGLQGNRAKNDNWHGRVLVPSNEVALAETVSTITLEGLGYIPSCLVNEARYWSRHTRTAKWHPFNFGMGRYAFTAINVTDLFDINAFVTPANGQRRQYLNRSSAPHGRISPTYLFQSGTADMDSGGPAATAFLNALAGGAGIGGGDYPSLADVPFTSFMDVNLAMAQAGNSLGGLASPYVNLIRNNNTSTFLSGNEEAARRSLFIAGGWNSDSNLTYEAYSAAYPGRINLRYQQFQPFDGCSWFPDSTTLAHCYNDVSASHPFWQPFNNNFPIISTALLCDYLDTDNVPLSLCIPCVEAVPMLCGVELTDGIVKYKVQYNSEKKSGNPDTGEKGKETITYKLHVDVDNPNGVLSTVYPFYNGPKDGKPSTYTAEAFVRIFFTEQNDGALNASGLRVAAGTGLGTMNLSGGSANEGVWNESANNRSDFIQATMGDAIIKADVAKGVGEAGEASSIQKDIAVQGPTVSKDVTLAVDVWELDEEGKRVARLDGECVNGTDIKFYDGNWKEVNFLDVIKGGTSTTKFRPNAAVWVRIKESGKTVDMVPAIPEYDETYIGSKTADLNGFNAMAGADAGIPLMRFFPDTGDEAAGIVLTEDYFKNNNESERQATWRQKAYMANDPRINWAPEQWWATDQTVNTADKWFDAVKGFRGSDIRDRDIFMSVSDSGYLQSMYEWMMIPQVRELFTAGGGSLEWGAFEGGSGYDGIVRTAAAGVAHNSVMWRTYRSDAFGYDNTWGSIDGLAFDEPENGLRVNPYTDMMPVMLGAFANMPCDWWSAGTNTQVSGKNYMDQNSPTFENGYLFDWSCKYSDVYNMAYYWMEVFNRKDLNVDDRQKSLYMADAWKDVFDNAFNWRDGETAYKSTESFPKETTLDTSVLSGNNATIDSILRDMTFTERKFLYGYLQGCFANTAQLFLVFVRAEASSGGAEGSGGRAVALVWRDPSAPMENGQFKKSSGGTETPQYGKDNAGKYLNVSGSEPEESWRLKSREYPPHRTRVLFYHQLD